MNVTRTQRDFITEDVQKKSVIIYFNNLLMVGCNTLPVILYILKVPFKMSPSSTTHICLKTSNHGNP